ncbi:hypothetical protein [Corynebacterium sp. p3-SID1056]|uniref:hypothetical protein n=1 Tax=Corynebacterium sp. p3-SID1056 TaxID=2916092 RepID=UPI0021A55F0C|nr:hypothetical protein [Corynebacterium sp. p3-SID1056]MCT2339119.1 hypothetical protein [Corynebacterium sp. p3-SID1056]
MNPFARNTARYGSPEFVYSSLEDFQNREIPDGVHSIAYGDGHLDVLTEDRGAEASLIFFHGAVPWRKTTLPVFSGKSVTDGLEANLILVSDPSLELTLNLAWFVGDHERRLQQDLPAVLNHILASFSNHKHVITYGGSGGGFASLFYSTFLNNAIAIAANPQTSIANYHQQAVDRFVKATWPGRSIEDIDAVTDVSTLYCRPVDNPVIYVQALGDDHIELHMKPFLDAIAAENRHGVRFLWNGKGHIPPSKGSINKMLKDVVACSGNWSDTSDRLSLINGIVTPDILAMQRQYLAGLV